MFSNQTARGNSSQRDLNLSVASLGSSVEEVSRHGFGEINNMEADLLAFANETGGSAEDLQGVLWLAEYEGRMAAERKAEEARAAAAYVLAAAATVSSASRRDLYDSRGRMVARRNMAMVAN